jgi:thymidine kinase
MPQLLAIAEYVTKLHAICMVCGGTAQLSFRIEKNTADQVLVGAKDMYEARCRKCFHSNKMHAYSINHLFSFYCIRLIM